MTTNPKPNPNPDPNPKLSATEVFSSAIEVFFSTYWRFTSQIIIIIIKLTLILHLSLKI